MQFFINDAATTEIYTLSLHDALPISRAEQRFSRLSRSALTTESWDARIERAERLAAESDATRELLAFYARLLRAQRDRKSTRLNSSHSQISYAVFCLKKKTTPPYELR